MSTITSAPPSTLRIALIGNPNCGKSTLFNRLTGLRQRTGNFPGVTVERKVGSYQTDDVEGKIVDLPGTYSFHPNSLDEQVVLENLLGLHPEGAPDVLVYVAAARQLEKHLLLFSQICDLSIPVVLAINFIDELKDHNETLDVGKLSKTLGVPAIGISARTGEGIEDLEDLIRETSEQQILPAKSFYDLSQLERKLIGMVKDSHPRTGYAKLLLLHHAGKLNGIDEETQLAYHSVATGNPEFISMRYQVRETMQRYDRFTPGLRQAQQEEFEGNIDERIDSVALHPVAGPLIFMGLLFLIFQAIFTWSSWPMDLIELLFATVGTTIREYIPSGMFADFLVDGVLAGLGGVVIFVPQIAILFLLLTILEECGYMARVVYLFDRMMQRFGLNGRSLVAFTSSGACAIPAIMSARTISNPKERLITILVTPLISCSARIPVYTLLIGFAIPPVLIAGLFSAQALAFLCIYLISILSAFLAALAFKKVLKSNERSYLMIELPPYRVPVFQNVLTTVWIKTKAFLYGAGKIIIVISMVLWVLASFGPSSSMEAAEKAALAQAEQVQASPEQTADFISNARLEASYAGHIGKFIEPAIKPLGYDWKIGIALVTSFAAREVFVGTVATLYAIGSSEDEGLITDKLSEARHHDGAPVYTPATAVSLILFYLFAMQCMSTLAVTKRETGTWKWPIVQTVYMTLLAYGAAFIAFQLLS